MGSVIFLSQINAFVASIDESYVNLTYFTLAEENNKVSSRAANIDRFLLLLRMKLSS